MSSFLKKGKKLIKRNLSTTTEYYRFVDLMEKKVKRLIPTIRRINRFGHVGTHSSRMNLKLNYNTEFVSFENQTNRLEFHPYNGGVVLHQLWVSEKTQKQGVGSKLMELIKQVSIDNNIPVYLIPVPTDNVSMDVLRKFYHKFGYKREQNSRYWKFNPDNVFRLSHNFMFKKVS